MTPSNEMTEAEVFQNICKKMAEVPAIHNAVKDELYSWPPP
jgi:hypothetical protein